MWGKDGHEGKMDQALTLPSITAKADHKLGPCPLFERSKNKLRKAGDLSCMASFQGYIHTVIAVNIPVTVSCPSFQRRKGQSLAKQPCRNICCPQPPSHAAHLIHDTAPKHSSHTVRLPMQNQLRLLPSQEAFLQAGTFQRH